MDTFDCKRDIEERKELIANLERALKNYELDVGPDAEINDYVQSIATSHLKRLRQELNRLIDSERAI
jgi:seryl-tRNA(Sec) selenium transferase